MPCGKPIEDGTLEIKKALPLHNPERGTKAYQDQQFRKAGKMYEQQFIREMVKAMRQTVKPSGLIKQNFAEKLFREQLDNEYVEGWSNRGGIGLADMIYQQLNERYGSQNGTLPRPKGPVPIQQGKATVEQTPQKEVFKILNSPQLPNSSQFIFEGPNKSFDVSAPWDGKVTQVFRSEIGNAASSTDTGLGSRTVVDLDHDNGSHSKIVFEGKALDLSPGTRIKAGDVIGATVDRSSLVSWKVTTA